MSIGQLSEAASSQRPHGEKCSKQRELGKLSFTVREEKVRNVAMVSKSTTETFMPRQRATRRGRGSAVDVGKKASAPTGDERTPSISRTTRSRIKVMLVEYTH